MAADGGRSEIEAYGGPYVSARDPAGRWLWITDGARAARTGRLEPSQPSPSAPPQALSVELDDETVERVIDSYRNEAWGIDDGSGLEIDFAEDEVGDYIADGDAISGEPPADGDGEGFVVDVLPAVVREVPDSPPSGGDHLKADPQAVRVNVLGSVEVDGWQEAPSRGIVAELACYLALHPGRPIPSDELRAALWPEGDREASAKSLSTRVAVADG